MYLPEVEDTRAMIDRYLNDMKETQRSQRSFRHGFLTSRINEHVFPLLSPEELSTFKSEYEDLLNRLFPKQ